MNLKGVSLDLDAAVAADDKLMKHVNDWPAPVRWAFDWINKGLAALGKPEIDEEAVKHPGEYFDDLVAMVKAIPARTPKAIAIKAAMVWALDWVHDFIHPQHVGA